MAFPRVGGYGMGNTRYATQAPHGSGLAPGLAVLLAAAVVLAVVPLLVVYAAAVWVDVLAARWAVRQWTCPIGPGAVLPASLMEGTERSSHAC